MLLKRSAGRKRSVAVLIAFASLFAVSVLVFPSAIQPAHASGGILVQSKNTCTASSGVVACAFTSSVTAGDVMIMVLESSNNIGSVFTSIHDTGSDTFSEFTAMPTAGGYLDAWYATAGATGAETITYSTSYSSLNVGVIIMEVSGILSTPNVQEENSAASSASVASFIPGAGSFVLGWGITSTAGDCTTPTGFTAITAPTEGDQQCATSTAGNYLGVAYVAGWSSGSTTVAWASGGAFYEGAASFQAIATQPITATFASTYGGSAQTVTVSGCSYQSPSTFTGNGGTTNVAMTSACAFTLSVPSGYQWIGANTGAACASGTCTTFSATYEQSPVTETVTISPGESYSSADSASVTGCDPSVSSVAMNGAAHSFSAEPSATCTYTVTESGTAGYIFSGGALTATHSTSASGLTDTYSFTVYRQYYNTFTVSANAQTDFDTGMSWAVAITADGAGASCTISSTAATSDSASCWSDYNQATTIPQLAASPPASSRWASTAACANTPTTGGNTYTCASYKQWTETWEATANAQSTFDSNLQTVVKGTSVGVSGSTLCTISPTGGVATGTCAAYIDNAQAATFSSSMSGAGSNVQWVCSTCATAAQTTGANTVNVNYFKQVLNTFEATTNGAGPPQWDSGLSIAVTGTSLGVGSSTLCTLSPSSGTTTIASCAVYSDYGAAATEPAAASGAGTNIRWDVTGTSSWTPTSGGNTYAGAYYKQLYNTYAMVPGTPTTWDQAYTEPVKGTYFGASLTTVCSVSLANAGGSASCASWSDYGTASGPPGSFNDKTTGAWSATGTYSFTETTGGNTLSVSYDDNGGTVTQPIEITIAASGPSGTFTLSGCQVSPATIVSDGTVHDISAIDSCPITLTVPTDGATARYRIGSGYATSAGITTCAGSGTTCTTASESSTQQDLVTLSNCNGASLSPTSPTGDMWYNYATASVHVTCNGVWSRSGGTGTRAISYNWEGGTNTAVLTTATFTADSPEVVTGQTLNVNPTTQYFVTLDSGATSALSSCNPTITGDGCWYDAGTTADVTLNGVYNRAAGTGARLTSWKLDTSGSINGLATTQQTTIQIAAIGGPHAIFTTTATQYQVTPSIGLTLSASTLTNDTGWYDADVQVTVTGSGGAATYVVSSPFWANQVSSFGVQLVTNDNPSSVNFGSLDLTFTCTPSCSVRLFVPATSGLSVQEVTAGGSSTSYSTQGFITSFSGSPSTWEVYFGQVAVIETTTAASSTTTTSSTSSAAPTGLFANPSTSLYIEIAAAAAVAIAVVVIALKEKKSGDFIVKIKNKVG